jgi:hypothetical protein
LRDFLDTAKGRLIAFLMFSRSGSNAEMWAARRNNERVRRPSEQAFLEFLVERKWTEAETFH